jgi:2'-5' RNA ligase
MAFLFLKVPHETARLLHDVEVPGEKSHIEEMHITLLYLGKGIPFINIAKAMMVCHEVLEHQQPFLMRISKISTFPENPDDGVPIICPVESPELMIFQKTLANEFNKFGLEYDKKFPDFKPHVTLAYDKNSDFKESPLPMPMIWAAQSMSIWGGDRGDGPAEINMPFTLTKISKAAAKITQIGWV